MSKFISVATIIIWGVALLLGAVAFIVMWAMVTGAKDSTMHYIDACVLAVAHFMAIYCGARGLSFILRECSLLFMKRNNGYWAMSPNEVRALRGRPPYDGGGTVDPLQPIPGGPNPHPMPLNVKKAS